MADLNELCSGLSFDPLPPFRARDPSVPHAPARITRLSPEEKKLALQNALKYFPAKCHATLAPEFAQELKVYGHIYMYRFRPVVEMRAYPIHEYPAKTCQAAAIMHMIMNNLDSRVAQFPHELVTYGGNGQVFSNWAQFRLVMHYLSQLTCEQTLVLHSGHPVGVFPSSSAAPRMVVSNGMVIPNYSSKEDYDRMFALGVTMYGQMTAGSFCYIGPQGIVHGTTLTVINAGRKYLGVDNLQGKVFVTSGLGGMSGAQAKAATIVGCIGVIAEVDLNALEKRHKQGWLQEWTASLDDCIGMIRKARQERRSTSIGYHGNVVDLWERLGQEHEQTGELLVELGSDQTSLHNPYGGGYYPVQLSFDRAQQVMKDQPAKMEALVQESLRRHVSAINKLARAGMYFWDYGNGFLKEAGNAKADVFQGGEFKGPFSYPSYVEDIMGDIFSMGFGPFRWVCASGSSEDLNTTDSIAKSVMEAILSRGVPEMVRQQYEDNLKWIQEARQHNLVVGSQARILYSNDEGRIKIALAFNEAIANGTLKGPVVLSRDHHDVSGTDSPFRETANIYDGSQFCADMAIQNVIGGSFRGATWVAIHNGGGVGWGDVVNGGFGLVLDGTAEVAQKAKAFLSWDVLHGVARRSWSGNPKAKSTISAAMVVNPTLQVTVPFTIDDKKILDQDM